MLYNYDICYHHHSLLLCLLLLLLLLDLLHLDHALLQLCINLVHEKLLLVYDVLQSVLRFLQQLQLSIAQLRSLLCVSLNEVARPIVYHHLLGVQQFASSGILLPGMYSDVVIGTRISLSAGVWSSFFRMTFDSSYLAKAILNCDIDEASWVTSYVLATCVLPRAASLSGATAAGSACPKESAFAPHS